MQDRERGTMNILIIHHYPGLGGATLSCYDVAGALFEVGYHTVVSVPSGENEARRLAEKLKIEVVDNTPPVIQFTYHNGSSGIARCVLKYLKLQRYITKWEELIDIIRPDIVLLNSSVQWPMIKLFKRKGIKSILFVRETMRKNQLGMINKYIRKKFCQADGIAFLTKYDLEQWRIPKYVNQYIIPDSVNKDNYNMTRTKEESRKKLGLDIEKFYVLYVGGINSIKGAGEIVSAMEWLEEPFIETVILGNLAENLCQCSFWKSLIQYKEVKYVKKVYRQIEAINKKEPRIHLKGLQRKMDDWLNACDVLVFPVGKVHQARPLYEAGLFQKPVILPDYENFRDNAGNMKNVLYYKKKDEKDLALKIQYLFYNKKSAEELGHANRIMAEKKHLSSEVNKEIVRLVNEIYQG